MSQAYSVLDLLRIIPYVFAIMLILWGIIDAYRCWSWKHESKQAER